jgi:hypothetical protein
MVGPVGVRLHANWSTTIITAPKRGHALASVGGFGIPPATGEDISKRQFM